jgi:hypothetical protein
MMGMKKRMKRGGSVKKRMKKKKKRVKKNEGGTLKPVPAGNKGLPKLSKDVRNKMGFLKRGGKVMKRGGKV